MSEEMRVHLEMATEANLAAGMSPMEARAAARREFGGVEQVKESYRDQRGLPWLEDSLRDLRFAVRSLRRSPGFSLTVLATLTLCIGPNTAILSALYALVLKPLPYPEPGQLVTVVNVAEKGGGQVVQSSTTQFLDFKAHADLFAGFSALRRDDATLDQEGAPIRVAIVSVAGDFFGVLGVKPILGRFFTQAEEVAGRNHVLVVSQNIWESRYNSDPAVIGGIVHMGEQVYTIIGVAPRSLECLCYQTCFFQPYVPAASKFDLQTRFRGDLALYARLKPGVSPSAGRAQLAALERIFLTGQAGPPLRALAAAAGYRLAIEPLRTGGWVGETSSLWLLQGGALLVLLIGCVNVVNLFLARMNAKRTELAIRVALGAGRGALLRQMLAESLLLSGTAAASGLALALLALRVFNRYLPIIMAGTPPVTFDATVTGAMVVVAGAIALPLGFLPLQLVWRAGLRIGDSRTASSGGGARAVSNALVTTQVAVAVILLVGASLLLRSFGKVMAIDPGFDATHVVQARTTLPAQYNNAAVRVGVQRRIVAALKEIPGVENVAVLLSSVLLSNERPVPFGLRGEPVTADDGESRHLIHIDAVSPEFFVTMGMRVVSGRAFNDADEFPQHPVAIVDQAFVQRYFPGRIVEGQEIYLNWGFPLGVDARPRIVGVVSRANFTGLDSGDNLPFVFVSAAGYPASGFNLLVRSQRPAAEILGEMRTKLREIDSTLPLFATGSLDDGLANLLMARRGITLLLGLFSGLALLLAAIGLYGVLSYDVSQRTREIGIRGAIGASRGQIVAMILRQGLWKTGVGLVIGLGGAFFLSRYMRSLLFEVPPTDPLSFGGVSLLLLLVAVLASWLPARRAAKIDPMVALRVE
jgi:predicted permease